MSKQAVLFDIDGTLVDSNEAHVEAWCRAFAREGFHFDRSAIHHQIGKGGDNLLPSLIPDAPKEVQDRVDQLHGDIYRAEYLHRVKPFADARGLLQKARESGMDVVLATSASRPELDHYVELLDAGDIISGATSKDDVEHSKPCPDIFAAALDEAGVDAAQATVVGDTPYDLAAANKLGIRAIAVRSGGFADKELAACNPAAIYDDAAELLRSFDTSPLAR